MILEFKKRHARASSGCLRPNTEGSASIPADCKALEKTKKYSAGIRRRSIQLDGALADLIPASVQAAAGPPTASITSLTVETMITRSDNSRNVIVSSAHGLSLSNLGNVARMDLAMYSKTAAAKRLIQTQEALELTNAAISSKLGIASNAWSQYRTADRTIPHKALVSLKEQFGVTSDWILAGDPSGLPQRLYARLRIAA